MVFLPSVFNSCSSDDSESFNEKNDIVSNSAKYRGDVRTLYLTVLNSENQFETFSALENDEKIAVWEGKLDDFIANSELDSNELNLINEIKGELTESLFENKNENFNSDKIRSLELEAMQTFGNKLGISLFYDLGNVYFNGEIEQEMGCFWCDNELVSIDGPCYWTNINGNWSYLEPITTKKIRFWITVGYWETTQPCSQ